MNLVFRLVWVVVAAFFRPRLSVVESSAVMFRVWPLDMDINLHLTNARYLSLMDLGRADFIVRSGAWRLMRKERLGTVLGGVAVRFRRSLAPFERFSLTTKLLGWDERWIYVEQVFKGKNGVACIAVARATFIKSGKAVPFSELLRKAELDVVSPELPSWVGQWAEVEAAFAK